MEGLAAVGDLVLEVMEVDDTKAIGKSALVVEETGMEVATEEEIGMVVATEVIEEAIGMEIEEIVGMVVEGIEAVGETRIVEVIKVVREVEAGGVTYHESNESTPHNIQL